MNSLSSKNGKQLLEDAELSSEEEIRRILESRMLRAIQDRGVRSLEAQTLKLEYRNLDTGIRLGLI